MQKVDAILAENPSTSLDDLVAARKINADQKAQALKKPALQSSLSQLEEQIAQYKKVDAEYQAKIASERDSLTASHKAAMDTLTERLKKEAEDESRATLRKKLLTFSQFLRAAAAKRAIEEEADTEDSKAFEGALLLVYGGDDKAVDAAESLIEGADEQVPSVEGQLLSVKCTSPHPVIISPQPRTNISPKTPKSKPPPPTPPPSRKKKPTQTPPPPNPSPPPPTTRPPQTQPSSTPVSPSSKRNNLTASPRKNPRLSSLQCRRAPATQWPTPLRQAPGTLALVPTRWRSPSRWCRATRRRSRTRLRRRRRRAR